MTERTHISASPACGQWETLLADALDGVLDPREEAFFASHKADCPFCTALYEEARRGREWLDFLSMEPEIPADLVDKILAITGPGIEGREAAGFGLLPSELQPASAGGAAILQPWQRPRNTGRGFFGTLRRIAEPRLMLTIAMAFFSIGLTLNLTGVKLRDLRVASLRPQAVRSYMERQVAVVSTPIVRYYDHMRLVYEVQTRMKELRRSTESGSQPDANGTGNGNGTGESQQAPGKKEGGSKLDRSLDPPEQSVTPAANDFLETRLERNQALSQVLNQLQHRNGSWGHREGVHRGSSSSNRQVERGTEWIA